MVCIYYYRPNQRLICRSPPHVLQLIYAQLTLLQIYQLDWVKRMKTETVFRQRIFRRLTYTFQRVFSSTCYFVYVVLSGKNCRTSGLYTMPDIHRTHSIWCEFFLFLISATLSNQFMTDPSRSLCDGCTFVPVHVCAKLIGSVCFSLSVPYRKNCKPSICWAGGRGGGV